MNRVYFISDLHLGHSKILEFSREWRQGNTVQEHDNWIVSNWNNTVTTKDTVYLLGDIAFTRDGLELCKKLRGIKKVILGNHDKFSIEDYEACGFKILPSLFKYKEYWLSHAPIHPEELRGKSNIHGHVHHKSIADIRYINVSVEAIGGIPKTLDQLINNKN